MDNHNIVLARLRALNMFARYGICTYDTSYRKVNNDVIIGDFIKYLIKFQLIIGDTKNNTLIFKIPKNEGSHIDYFILYDNVKDRLFMVKNNDRCNKIKICYKKVDMDNNENTLFYSNHEFEHIIESIITKVFTCSHS